MQKQRAEIRTELFELVNAQGKSRSTAKSYWHWFCRFLDFNLANPAPSLTAEESATRFLSHLANRECVSSNTQNQALAALCYVYEWVFKRPLVGVNSHRAKKPDRIRDVCDTEEIKALIENMTGIHRLMVCVIYGCSGLRIGEVHRLRVKDFSFERKQLHIWDAKGSKDRVVQFPAILHEPVRHQMEVVKTVWRYDNDNRLNGVSLPDAFGRKSKSAHLEFAWYWLFPAEHYSKHPETKQFLRHHRHESGLQKAIRAGVRKAGVPKRITAHCIRHSSATHAIEHGTPIHVLKELMGHISIETTETYLHVSKDGVTSAKSPIDTLGLVLNKPPATIKLFTA